jgi:diguanylate cyclase (GGDEF)-like protein/PAS domain S-box-containing protein
MDNRHQHNEGSGQTEEDWYSALFQPNSPPIYIYEATTLALLDVNEAAVQQYGYSRTEFLQMNMKNIRPADEIPASAATEAIDRGFRPAGIWRHLKKNGDIVCANVRQHAISYQGKNAVLVIAQDVTAQMNTTIPFQFGAPDLNSAQAISHIGSWIWEVSGNEMHWSDEAFRIYGYQPNMICPSYHIYKTAIYRDDRMMAGQAIDDAIAGTRPYDNDHRITLPNGQTRLVREQGKIQQNESGQSKRMLGTVEDVTEQRQAEGAINQIAFFDDVTGLPNRSKFRNDLQQALQIAQQHNQHLVVLIVQLERLRDINFTLGQANGDLLLRQIGPRLREVLPLDAPLARVGDVQFATILMRASAFSAAHTAEHIIDAVKRPFDITGVTFAPGAHIGAALYPVHGTDADTLIQHANIAVFQASRYGKNYVIYSSADDPYKPQRLSMLGEFRQAVENGQLLLYCQPKANIQTGCIVGAEALVRWQHPQYGFISPADFIPLIEPTELIVPLTEWMLESAISQCYSWHQTGINLPLAVNLSARNLQERNLAELIYELLNTWGAETSWLDLEITESSIMVDPAAAKKVLEQLHQYGFRLFVDDYGTGYSNLSYLVRLPVDSIKIDQSFVMAMLQDKQAAAIVKSTIELAHNLDIKVVAEGTASQEIWDALKPLGCAEAQGNFISPPMPASELKHWLASSNWKLARKEASNEHAAIAEQGLQDTHAT